MCHRHVDTDPLANGDLDAELFLALPHESVEFVLPRLHLATGELPFPGHLGRLRTLTAEHPAVGDNRGADDDQRSRPLCVHDDQACQTPRVSEGPTHRQYRPEEGMRRM